MKWINLLALIILSTPSMTFAQIPRKDVLICALPNGDQFILTSKYKWSLYFNPHNGQEYDRHSTETSFKKSGSSRKSGIPIDIPIEMGFGGNKNKQSLINVCANGGMIAGILIVPNSYLRADGTWFPPRLISEKSYSLVKLSRQEGPIRKKLEEKNIAPHEEYTLVFPRKNRLVYEMALLNLGDSKPSEDSRIMAVFKSISHDDGKTWSDPEITEDAEIYELGKSAIEQSFIARPIKVNGKKAEEFKEE